MPVNLESQIQTTTQIQAMNISRNGIRILPPRRRVDVKQCHKRRHPTRDAAFDALVAFEAITGDLSMTVYKCPWCRDADGNYGWHFGHRERDPITQFFKRKSK